MVQDTLFVSIRQSLDAYILSKSAFNYPLNCGFNHIQLN